ncbi:MAG: ASCH domain-containing protein [Thaumarchaeota archaeon]|nr:ASCH domain-containing protein [Nitrososphaerota archaeon]
MKCLSVSQPYADLIVQGRKTIELRRWNTGFRGEFLVHAPLKINTDACRMLGVDEKELRRGVIIGRVEIFGVRVYKTAEEIRLDYEKHLAGSDFQGSRYGFLLRNPRELLVPIPCKGKLGFFEADLGPRVTKNELISDLFDEEHRYQWIGKH